MKKKYYINKHYDMCFSVEVIAESEEEAYRLADEITETMNLNEADCCGSEACITYEEELWKENKFISSALTGIWKGKLVVIF